MVDEDSASQFSSAVAFSAGNKSNVLSSSITRSLDLKSLNLKAQVRCRKNTDPGSADKVVHRMARRGVLRADGSCSKLSNAEEGYESEPCAEAGSDGAGKIVRRNTYTQGDVISGARRSSMNNSSPQDKHQDDEIRKAHRASGELLGRTSEALRKVIEDLTEEELDRASSSGSSWIIYGQLPVYFESEFPYSVRNKVMLPTGDAGEVLSAWGVGVYNMKGCKSESDLTVGQDNFCVSRLASGWEVFSVCDGHGIASHYSAARVVRTISWFLDNEPCSGFLKSGREEQAIQHAFELAQQDLEYRHEMNVTDILFAGTTAAFAFRNPADRSKLWIANCGDSRAVLVKPGAGSIQETRIHQPIEASETARIEQMGGEIVTKAHADGYVERRVVRKGGDRPKIAMSRSLGDLYIKPNGVIADPEVVSWSLQGNEDSYVLLATDGVWEFMEPSEVSEFILPKLQEGKSCSQVAKALLVQCRQLWKTKEGGYCDDITIILFPANLPQAPKTEVQASSSIGSYIVNSLRCLLMCTQCKEHPRTPQIS